MVRSWRTTSAMRSSRTLLAGASTAARAAASQDSLLTPTTSVTRYTLSAMTYLLGKDGAGSASLSALARRVSRVGARTQLEDPTPGSADAAAEPTVSLDPAI